MTVGLDDVRAAARAIAGSVVRTPTIPAPSLSEALGVELAFKLENLQAAGSFKARGALNRMLALSAEQRALGVVAMSAGNHAQGVAWHARRLGVPATIVMPALTPFTKVARTQGLGATVVLEGETLSDAEEHARLLAERDGLTLIHPYDDALIIAGQGTVALEMLDDRPDLDAVVVPVGGGGLVSGVATAVKALSPHTQVIGVQAESYATFARKAPPPPPPASLKTLAEGIAVKRPGVLTKAIITRLVDDIVCVDEDTIERAVEMLVEYPRVVAEGAGAAGLAGVLAQPERFRGKRVGVVVSGGNIDNRLLSSILLRGLVRQGRLARLRIGISDAPGTLAKVAELIGKNGGNILEVTHQRLFQDVPVKFAEVDAVVEATDGDHLADMIRALCEAGFPTRLLGSRATGE